MSTLTDTIGSIDPVTLAKEYPYLATKLSLQTAKAAGMDTSDPKNAITALHSDAFQTTVKETASDRRDSRALNRIMGGGNLTIPVFDPNADPAQTETQGFQSAADSIKRTSLGRGILFKQVMDETNNLGKLADFNESAYKKKRITEMRPTEDIDREILDLRNRALFSKAAMYDDLAHLPYGAQTRAVAAMQKVFIDQINSLQDLRTARVKDAEDKVQEEIDAHTSRVSASQAKLDGLSKAISILKEQGADEQAIAQLTIDHSKEMERLRKVNASGKGITDTKNVIAQALTQKYIKEHAGDIPDASAKAEIDRQAEFIVKNKGDLTAAVLNAGGNLDALTTTKETTETVPRNLFLRALPDALVSPTTTRTRSVTSDVFDDSGFGIPYSAGDEADLKRKRQLAGIKE